MDAPMIISFLNVNSTNKTHADNNSKCNFTSSTSKTPLKTHAYCGKPKVDQKKTDTCSTRVKPSVTSWSRENCKNVIVGTEGENDHQRSGKQCHLPDLTIRTKYSANGMSATVPRAGENGLTDSVKKSLGSLSPCRQCKRTKESIHLGDSDSGNEKLVSRYARETGSVQTSPSLINDSVSVREVHLRQNDIFPQVSSSDTCTCSCSDRYDMSSCQHCRLSNTVNAQPHININDIYKNSIPNPKIVNMLDCQSKEALHSKEFCNISSPVAVWDNIVSIPSTPEKSQKSLATPQITREEYTNFLVQSKESQNTNNPETLLFSKTDKPLFSPLSHRSLEQTLNSRIFSASGNGEQQPEAHSEIIMEKMLAESMSQSPPTRVDVEELMQKFLKVIFTSYRKTSSRNCWEMSAVCRDEKEIPLEPSGQTKKKEYKKKTGENNCSSPLFLKRCNPDGCEKDSKPLLQVKYNAPVTCCSRHLCHVTGNAGFRIQAKHVSPNKSGNLSSSKKTYDLKKNAFSNPPVSSQKLKKQKIRPSRNANSQGAKITTNNNEVTNERKEANKRALGQRNSRKTRETASIWKPNASMKFQIHQPTKEKDGPARNRQTIDKSGDKYLLDDSVEEIKGWFTARGDDDVYSATYNLDDEILCNSTAEQHLCPCVTDQPTSPTVTPVKGCSNKKDTRRRKISSECEKSLNMNHPDRKITKSDQKGFPKRSYGRENLLIDDQTQIRREERRSRFKSPSNEADDLSDDLSLNELLCRMKSPVSSILSCHDIRKDLDATKQNKLLEQLEPKYAPDIIHANEQTPNTIIHQDYLETSHTYGENYDESETVANTTLNTKLRDEFRCMTDDRHFKQNLGFYAQVCPVEDDFWIQNARHESGYQNYYYYQHNQNVVNAPDSQDQYDLESTLENIEALFTLNDTASVDRVNANGGKQTCFASGNSSTLTGLKDMGMVKSSPENSVLKNSGDKNAAKNSNRNSEMSLRHSTELMPIGDSHAEKCPYKVSSEEGLQSAQVQHYYSLPLNLISMKNSVSCEDQQLSFLQKNSASDKICWNKSKTPAISVCKDVDSSETARAHSRLSLILPSSSGSQFFEIVNLKKLPEEPSQMPQMYNASRANIIHCIVQELKYQYLAEKKSHQSRHSGRARKRRNLSRLHVLGHGHKVQKTKHSTMHSSRTHVRGIDRLDISKPCGQHQLFEKSTEANSAASLVGNGESGKSSALKENTRPVYDHTKSDDQLEHFEAEAAQTLNDDTQKWNIEMLNDNTDFRRRFYQSLPHEESPNGGTKIPKSNTMSSQQNEKGSISYERGEPTFVGKHMRYSPAAHEHLTEGNMGAATCYLQLTKPEINVTCIQSESKNKTDVILPNELIKVSSPHSEKGSTITVTMRDPHLDICTILPWTHDNTCNLTTDLRSGFVEWVFKQPKITEMDQSIASKDTDIVIPGAKSVNSVEELQIPSEPNENDCISLLKEHAHDGNYNPRVDHVVQGESILPSCGRKLAHNKNCGSYHDMDKSDPWCDYRNMKKPHVTSTQDAPLDLSRKIRPNISSSMVTYKSHKYDALINGISKSRPHHCGTSLFLPEQESPLNLSTKSCC